MTISPSLDRRGLLRAGGVTALVGAAATLPTLSAPATAARATTPSAALTTRNPLVEQRADPFITRPHRGTYFMTGSVPEYDRLVVRGAPTLDGLASARERTIWRRPTSGRMAGYLGAGAAPDELSLAAAVIHRWNHDQLYPRSMLKVDESCRRPRATVPGSRCRSL